MQLGSPTSVKKARVEIIPLIDVMFFLLAAFMMVTLTMNRLRTLQMDLPSAVAPKSSDKPDMMEIIIDRDGDLKVGGKLLPFSELPLLPQARLPDDPWQRASGSRHHQGGRSEQDLHGHRRDGRR